MQSPFYSPAWRVRGDAGRRVDQATHGAGTTQAADAVFGDTHPPPRSRILTDCKPPGAGTRPTHCCCPATAVSVFYYDFLRLSVCRPRGVSGDPSVSLCPFPVPRSQAHTCTRAHTRHTRPPQSPGGQRGTGTRVTVARPSHTPGGGGVLGMGPSSGTV